MKLIVVVLPFILSLSAFGHGKEKHSTPEMKKEEPIAISTYEQINLQYQMKVEPIFKSKCLDCHSSQTTYPWYYQIPVVNYLINSDIKEARSHIEMSKGFPFGSHSTPLKDLQEIEKSILSSSMPPFKYRALHRNAALTKAELELIISWTKSSKNLLKDLK